MSYESAEAEWDKGEVYNSWTVWTRQEKIQATLLTPQSISPFSIIVNFYQMYFYRDLLTSIQYTNI